MAPARLLEHEHTHCVEGQKRRFQRTPVTSALPPTATKSMQYGKCRDGPILLKKSEYRLSRIF
jgi:hypothetical protein